MSALITPSVPVGKLPPPSTGTGPRPWNWTREQYHKACDQGFFDGTHVQLIFGEIVEMGKQGWPHAAALSLLVEVLRRVFAPNHWIYEQKPFPVAGSEPEPDAAVIPGSPRDYTDHPTTAVLVVEVSDTTLNYDLSTKAELYATAGIAEYWVLDVTGRQLHVLRDPQLLPAGLAATAYSTHLTFAATDTVSPLSAPGTSIRIGDLLP